MHTIFYYLIVQCVFRNQEQITDSNSVLNLNSFCQNYDVLMFKNGNGGLFLVEN